MAKETTPATAGHAKVRQLLRNAMKIVNVILNFLGIAIIVYSLWLQKKWNDGSAELPSYSSLPKPWFIHACLGVGIAVCLSTLFSYIVSKCMSNSILCTYIFSVCSLLSLEVVVIVTIFFKYDCCSVIVIALATSLWTVGIERITQSRHSGKHDFTRSFLVGTGSGILNNTTKICSRCEALRTGNPTQSLILNNLF